MQSFSFFFKFVLGGRGGGGVISGRVRALNLTVPLGSGRVGSDDLGYGPGSGFSFEPVQTSTTGSFRKTGNGEQYAFKKVNIEECVILIYMCQICCQLVALCP